MNTIETYSVHRPRRHKFKRRITYVPGKILFVYHIIHFLLGMFHTLFGDLVDYRMYDHANSNFKYILVLIDGFSRYAWTRALKTKTALETSQALDDILSTIPFNIPFFASDRGNEFLVRNNDLKKILIDKYHMKPYTLSLKPKASIVERLNRTLKERIQRYFTDTGKKRWVDVLENFTTLYNNTLHSSIGMTPAEVTLENSDKIREKLYGNRPPAKCDLKPGDKVRIVLEKGIFEKGYRQNWSDRVYIIIRQRSHFDVCVYEG